MSVKRVCTCDYCGKPCIRWYELSACPMADDPQINVADMIPTGGSFVWQKQACVDCFTARFITPEPKREKEQGVLNDIDDAFEAGWKSCQKHIAHSIELADVISREEAIHEVESMYSPRGKDGAGDAISRTAVLALLATLGKTEVDAGSA